MTSLKKLVFLFLLLFLCNGFSEPLTGNGYVLVDAREIRPLPQANEVIEFFSYSCSHCYVFETPLKKWQSENGKQRHITRVHIKRTDNNDLHQRLYFALEKLGVENDVHMKVFNEIHVQHNKLKTAESIIVFATKLGIDKKMFLESFNSQEVTSRIKSAQKLIDAYQIRSTPTLVISGRYKTGPAYFAKKKSFTEKFASIFQAEDESAGVAAQHATIDVLRLLSKQ